VRTTRAGDSFALSALCRVRVLHPPAEAAARPLPHDPDHRAADNETSLVLAVESAGRRLLLTGDIERDALRRFVAAGVERCDVLVAPHHGSRTSLPPDIARVTRPSWVLVSGNGNGAWPEVRRAYLHAAASPAPATEGESVSVVKTGDEGAVALSLTAGGITAARWMGRWRAGASHDDHGVLHPADAIDVDRHAISRGERERLVRDDARAREQHDAVRKRL
jgi:competence protein ComEC